MVWTPRAGAADVRVVDYGSNAQAPRPPLAKLVHWRGDPGTLPDLAVPGDMLYVPTGLFG